MKIQSLAVVFAIIVLPIVIILSYYIHGEVDTIAIQTSYDTKLIDSTHDAMSAFEINTANEDLSSVADSLRSIIEASTNVFFNTLATNLGISNAGNAAVDSYVPALLYTLYDGYYIYAPTRNPQVLTYNQDDIIYVGDRGVTYLGTSTYRNANNELVKFGVYEFNEAEYAQEKDDDISNNETDEQRSIRQLNLYNSLDADIKYEFGQMLYLNEGSGATYSTLVHTNKQNPGDPEPTTGNTKYKQEHVLKSYMPYSARYVRNGVFDVTINYTLDNYLTVEGNIGNVYYSKTGYLIASDTVTSINVGDDITDILDYNEITAEEMILSGQYDVTLTIDPIMENGKRISEDGSPIVIQYNRVDNPEGGYYNHMQIRERLTKLYEKLDAGEDVLGEIQDLEYASANLSSICYYVKAQIFSNWLYTNLGGTNGIRASEIKDEAIRDNDENRNYVTDSEFDVYHKFIVYDDDGNIVEQDDTIIFQNDVNPELEDSPFASHKLNVIRNNIQYNLNLAISTYNYMLQARNVQLPVISDSEWNQILTRISVVSFLQGLNCGMKTYNNYAIASSTNNELTVIPSEIYYAYKDHYNNAEVSTDDEYHKIDCDKLLGDTADAKEYISFKSKEVKYDKLYNKETKLYSYDHRNLACYRCAIASNYEKDVAKDGAGNITRGYSEDIKISVLNPLKQKAYYMAVSKERQNLYKTNAITDSNGFERWYDNPINTFPDLAPADDPTLKTFSGDSYVSIGNGTSTRNLSEVRELEITLRDLKCDNASEATVNFVLRLNGTKEIDYNIVLNLAQRTPQTITVPIHIAETDTLAGSQLNKVELKKIGLADNVYCHDLNVRIVYE